MPKETADLLFRCLRQGEGRLSRRAREREFGALTEEEVERVEAVYGEAFGGGTLREGGQAALIPERFASVAAVRQIAALHGRADFTLHVLADLPPAARTAGQRNEEIDRDRPRRRRGVRLLT